MQNKPELDTFKTSDESTSGDTNEAKIHSSLQATLEKIKYFLESTLHHDALVLLTKAINQSKVDEFYAVRLESALLHGSTTYFREVFSDFGDYWANTRMKFPYRSHSDSVDAIDSAINSIRIDDLEEAIEDYNFFHNRHRFGVDNFRNSYK